MGITSTTVACAFVMVCSLVLLVFALIGGRKTQLAARLEELGGKGGDSPEPDGVAKFAQSALPKIGIPFFPKAEADRSRLQARLIHAGFYGPHAMATFLGIKMLLTATPFVVALLIGMFDLLPMRTAMLGGAFLGIAGLIVPGIWLDWKKSWRQMTFRISLPDALDVLVICLEGGLSFVASLRRLADEMQTAHPLLAGELQIVQRETQLGKTEGEALRHFGDRADLEEIKSLAGVINQAERFGASLAKALRVHADGLRTKRIQRARRDGGEGEG